VSLLPARRRATLSTDTTAPFEGLGDLSAISKAAAMTVPDFVLLVQSYVALVDGAASLPVSRFLRSCASLLPKLYAASLDLPHVEPDDTKALPSIQSPALASLGEHDLYWEIYDPYEESAPVMGSLSGDLREIYEDLVGPLREYEAGRIDNAIWSWRFNMTNHCGDHLVDAMRAIHRLVHGVLADRSGTHDDAA
jgi:hypothetical protein